MCDYPTNREEWGQLEVSRLGLGADVLPGGTWFKALDFLAVSKEGKGQVFHHWACLGLGLGSVQSGQRGPVWFGQCLLSGAGYVGQCVGEGSHAG
jgi:hypothetical protein